jgi:hypothetical protein
MYYYLNYETERHSDEPEDSNGDLTLSTGEFLVTDTGVMCRLADPLSKLSGHYDWERVPVGIATLKLLVVAPDSDAFEFVMNFFGEEERDRLDAITPKAGTEPDETEYLSQDVEDLLSWAPSLASKCPYPEIAAELESLPSMEPEELGDFVGRHLGLG